MKKLFLASVFVVLLVGCGVNKDIQKSSVPEVSFKPISVPAKFKLANYCKVEAVNCVSPILELIDGQNFTLTLNMCESVEKAEGVYAKVDNEYFLAVNKCLSCKKSNYGDLGLSTVNLELKQTADDELMITNEVYRIQDGQKLSFCAPSNDPHNRYAGFDYNLFKLVKGY